MIDPATVLPWSEPTPVATGRGLIPVRKAPATPEFWQLWTTHKDELKAAGIEPSRFHCDGTWEVFLWPNDFKTAGGVETHAVDNGECQPGRGQSETQPLASPVTAVLSPYVRPEGLHALTEADETYLAKCFSERQSTITCNGNQFIALCARKQTVHIFSAKVGKTPGQWICTVQYQDKELF